MDNHMLDPGVAGLRRVEVINGARRRRYWTSEAKSRIVAESNSSGLAISEVARQYGIRPQQLFSWRKQARKGRLAVSEQESASFARAVPDVAGGSVASTPTATNNSVIEIEVGGAIVRVRGEVSASALAEVLAAVKIAG
jgi:transposase